jgi:hypothetical protein
MTLLQIKKTFLVIALVILVLSQGSPAAKKTDRAIPTKKPEVVAPLTFNDQWKPATAIRTIEIVRPKPVESIKPIETVAIVEEPEPVSTPVSTPVKKKRTRQREARQHDICRGKGRYYINGGKSWRCNR